MEVAAMLRQKLMDSLKRKREREEDAEDGEILESSGTQEAAHRQGQRAQTASAPVALAAQPSAFPPQPWLPPVPVAGWAQSMDFVIPPGLRTQTKTPPIHPQLQSLPGSAIPTPRTGSPKSTIASENGKGRKLGSMKHSTLVIELDSDASDDESAQAQAAADRHASIASTALRIEQEQKLKAMEAKIAAAMAAIKQKEEQALEMAGPHSAPSSPEQAMPRYEPLREPRFTLVPDIAKAMLTIGEASEGQRRKRRAPDMQNGHYSAPHTTQNTNIEEHAEETAREPSPRPDFSALLQANEQALQAIKQQQDENDRGIYMQQRTLTILQSKDNELQNRRAELATEEIHATTQLAAFKLQVEQLMLEMNAFEAKALDISRQRVEIDHIIESSQQVQEDLKEKINSLINKRGGFREQVEAAQKALKSAQALQGQSFANVRPGRVAQIPQNHASSSMNGTGSPPRPSKRRTKYLREPERVEPGLSLAEIYSNSPTLTPEQAAEELQKRQLAQQASQQADPLRKLGKSTLDKSTLDSIPASVVTTNVVQPVENTKQSTRPAAQPAPLTKDTAINEPPTQTTLPGRSTEQANDAIDSLKQVPQQSNGYPSRYISPLHQFKSYKFHQEFPRTVSSGFRSKSYFHKINHEKMFCEAECLGGTCSVATCSAQHFQKIVMTG
ncbi:hypothetical protein BCR37DRAFT_379298 [Protomyces lactucae-debilis]|uniref:Zinc-finger domain-containing protein n=1 Tax=Protomyces lactucae-debilis TaxID=2754530 RepID=A0A1Y2FH66_PROLT|nr:uncharacterized protein BCR37DRAFT_379298 [Protomyces lactucae-debilis]ORY83269.1 hypothetical protein BCR37DRAFT_379298 [Protomyces lactucae-debilis]